LHITLSRAEGTDWKGHKGRVTKEFLARTVPDIAKHPVCICGPEAMMGPTIQLLKDLGVPADRIKSEEFVAAKHSGAGEMGAAVSVTAGPVEADEGGEPTLTFSRSGKSVALAADKTLLEIAEDAGVEIDFECRSGICGRCKTRLLGGSVTMETQDALSGEEKAQNIILMCQARATGRVKVEA
jgi:ferredoxin